MKKALGFVFSAPFLIIIGTLILSCCLWYFGPLLGFGESRPLESPGIRVGVIGGLWLIALLTIALILWRRQSREKELTTDIVEAEDATHPADEIVQGEISEMRSKLRDALGQLRKTKLGRRHLYELPWYIVIGPPGAGKTTAIVNSGLQFPLADKMGKNAIGGVGGTRNCDWWFTDEAVLIDTAGRYTTHESDAEADNSGWLGFLNLLKKHRKRQPINGAMIAISLSDLSMQDETTQKSHAVSIRRRLQELRSHLGVRFPVYVLFTKADLIAGFSEFFNPLGKEERSQVWGFTFPLKLRSDDAPPIAGFREEFDALLAQLNAQSLERIQAETDPQRRSLVAGFPNQVASLRGVANDFLKEVFLETRFEDRQMLRGVYFTSGTQEGTPIDRLMMSMARTFGIGRQTIGSGQGAGRSYFLTRLLKDVVFQEAGLVSADDKVERRYRWIKRGAIAATVVLALGLGGLWTRSYLGNQALLRDVDARIAEYTQAASVIRGNPIGDTDLPSVVPALNILRDLPGNPVVNQPVVESRLAYGLYQGDAVGTQAAQTYRAALNQHLLPRLILRLEEQVQDSINDPNLLYEALKTYLILGLQGPMDRDLVREWLNLDWQFAYPGPQNDVLRQDLAIHVDALLSQPMKTIELNGPLIDQVQSILSEMPLAERIYNGIVSSPLAADLPKWRITDVGGPAVSRVFVRPSGKSLSDGINGIYTYDGFNSVFLNEALQVAERLQGESWVMGARGAVDQSETVLATMSRDVLNLYYNDFIREYEAILGDLDIIPLESLNQSVEITNVLSGPTSPIVSLLEAIAEETRLTEDRAPASNQAATEGAGQLLDQTAARFATGRKKLLVETLMKANAAQGGGDTRPPGAYVEDRFAWLQQLVAKPDGAPSQLDAVVDKLEEVYRELSRTVLNNGSNAGSESGSALVQLRQEAARIEGPLQRWASQIGGGLTEITAQGTRAQLNARWQSQVLSFCTQALDNRYPFFPRARADVATQDFARLFAPGGAIDAFVSENLLRYIDTSKKPWAWNNAELGISTSVLEQLQFAAEIRDVFFGAGTEMNVAFEMRPEALDPKANRVLLEIDGQQVSYGHGEQVNPVALKWPGSVGLGRVTFDPPLPGVESGMFREGPWAWFRLLNAAEVRGTNAPDQKRVIFRIGGRIAIFRMRSGSALTPFSLPALNRFRCPKSL